MIYPLSLSEYLKFNDFQIKKYYNSQEKWLLQNHIYNYINYWWYPEISLIQSIDKKIDIAKIYLDVMMYKDILERYKLTNEFVLKYCIKRILEWTSKLLSTNNIYNDLKSQNIKVSINTLYDIIQYLQNIFFLSLAENLYNSKAQKKIYIIDNVYQNIYAKQLNLWQKFENTIYNNIKYITKKNIYYQKNGSEIDIYNDDIWKIQICYELNYDNVDREIKWLNTNDTILTYEYPTDNITKICKDRDINIYSIYDYFIWNSLK